MKLFIIPVFDAVFLIVIGALIWASNLGIIHIVWRRDWPLIIVLVGLYQLVKYFVKR
ncbi:MAG: LiaI-LiaF-like domain-containing protein [bacterium]